MFVSVCALLSLASVRKISKVCAKVLEKVESAHKSVKLGLNLDIIKHI